MDVAAAAPAQAGSETLPAPLRALAARGQPRRYAKGTLLIQEGDQGDTLFIILSGRVKAFSSGERDREIVYGVYGAGEYFGEMSLDGGPRSASVITLEPTVGVAITRQTLLAHIAANPEFAFELLSRVIHRARMATQSARSMALLDVYERVVHLLDSLALPHAGGTRLIAERLTHAAIANRVGCSREMVSRLLKDLERGGHVQRADAGWLLPKPLPRRW
jgi:CRP/FNR family transcriptional regulator, cyclic AMP receptor protein